MLVKSMQRLAAIGIAIGLLAVANTPAYAAGFVVNSNGDESDSNLSDSQCLTQAGTCTLRAAIQQANALQGMDVITFVNGLGTIAPASPLPALMDGQTHILGQTSGGKIVIDGSKAGPGADGILIHSEYNVIQGLHITGFEHAAVRLYGLDSSAAHNIIGTNSDGANDGMAEGNLLSDSKYGVLIDGEGAHYNVVAANTIRGNRFGVTITNMAYDNRIGTDGNGTSDLYEGNVIVENLVAGVHLLNYADNTIAAGNFIGVDGDGLTDRGNGIGILVVASANVRIGTDNDGSYWDITEGNVISGNTGQGIHITAATGTQISGNRIGTDEGGKIAVPNGENGIVLTNAQDTLIGALDLNNQTNTYLNIISGNGASGIQINKSDATTIAGNTIGLDGTRGKALPNGGSGIDMHGAQHTVIGINGNGSGDENEHNYISGNTLHGIESHQSSITTISGNRIGTNGTGNEAIGNTLGVYAVEDEWLLIGTNGIQEHETKGNVISGNLEGGVRVEDSKHVSVRGNYIGTDASGKKGVGNGGPGLVLDGVLYPIVGVSGDGIGDELEANVIASNWGDGIFAQVAEGRISGNIIGMNRHGEKPLPNVGSGLHIKSAFLMVIGTDGNGISDDLEGNLISANALHGIEGVSLAAFTIAGNRIGTDARGKTPYGNVGDGMHLTATGNSRIGTDFDGWDNHEPNIIADSSGHGIYIEGSNNRFSGNYIGTDLSGKVEMGNALDGIHVTGPYTHANIIAGYGTIGANKLGSTDYHWVNVIAFNGSNGVTIMSGDNPVATNFIHSNGGLGIDLNGDGVTYNDSLNDDADTGPNHLQDFPLPLGYWEDFPPYLWIPVLGEPEDYVYVEVYLSPTCDPSGYGEGAKFVWRSEIVQLDNIGAYGIAWDPALVGLPPIPAGVAVTVLTVKADGTYSSEFSNCVEWLVTQ